MSKASLVRTANPIFVPEHLLGFATVIIVHAMRLIVAMPAVSMTTMVAMMGQTGFALEDAIVVCSGKGGINEKIATYPLDANSTANCTDGYFTRSHQNTINY